MRNFAACNRRNDINEQMRTIARHMTPAEIDEAALYYSGEAAVPAVTPKYSITAAASSPQTSRISSRLHR